MMMYICIHILFLKMITIEVIISILVIGLTVIGCISYCNVKRLQKRDKEFEKILVMIVNEINVQTREHSGVLIEDSQV